MLLLKGSCLPLLLVVLLSACDRSTVPAPIPKAEMSSSVGESTGQAMAQDKPAIDPQVSGDQARGAVSAIGQAKADPKGELTRQEESSAMPAPGQANDHSNVALDPKSNTKN
jgi:hypothetical protein